MILASPEKIREYTEKGWWGQKTLIEYFKENVKNNPDRVALIDPPNKEELVGLPPQRLRYKELDRIADAVATCFMEMGIGKDDIVMVQMPNSWELAMLYIAITRAGAHISPLPVQWRRRELEYIAKLTEAKAIITVNEFKGFNYKKQAEEIKSTLPHIKHVIVLEELRKMAEEGVDYDRLDKVEITANDIFTLCWTSGTEADPKGCPLSHNNWINQARIQIDTADIRPGDVQLTAGPLVNMASVGTTFVEWLILGGTFVLHHPFTPEIFIKQMIEEKVNYTLIVPAVGNMIVKHPKVDEFDLSNVRTITMGSAPPSLFTIKEFKRRWNISIGNIWGQNEGTALISGPKDVPDLEKRVDHLPQFGKPGTKWSTEIASRIQTKIVEPGTGKVLTKVGEVGELAYKGPNVIPGYFKRPDLTEKAFDEEGYFYTGDLFEIREDNFISFFDRKKDIIIRGGFNISAQEIENILLGHPNVIDVAAVAMPDEILGERVCVYVVPKQGVKMTLEDLTSYMKERGVAVYKLPERMEIIDEIPRNPVGKILKSRLREDIKKKLKEQDKV